MAKFYDGSDSEVERDLSISVEYNYAYFQHVFDGFIGTVEKNVEMPFLTWMAQIDNSCIISSLKAVTPGGYDSFYPVAGTLLGALRYGSVSGWTGKRHNFVDSDGDYVVFLRKHPGDAEGAARQRWVHKLKSLGTVAVFPRHGQSVFMVKPHHFVEYGDVEQEMLDSNRDKFNEVWHFTGALSQRFFGDVVVFEVEVDVDGTARKAFLDRGQKDAGLSDWLQTGKHNPETNSIRADLLLKVLPSHFKGEAHDGAVSRLRLDGHDLFLPNEVFNHIPRWKDPSKVVRLDSFVLPLDGQITSGAWYNTDLERPLDHDEVATIAESAHALSQAGYASVGDFLPTQDNGERKTWDCFRDEFFPVGRDSRFHGLNIEDLISARGDCEGEKSVSLYRKILKNYCSGSGSDSDSDSGIEVM